MNDAIRQAKPYGLFRMKPGILGGLFVDLIQSPPSMPGQDATGLLSSLREVPAYLMELQGIPAYAAGNKRVMNHHSVIRADKTLQSHRTGPARWKFHRQGC